MPKIDVRDVDFPKRDKIEVASVRRLTEEELRLQKKLEKKRREKQRARFYRDRNREKEYIAAMVDEVNGREPKHKYKKKKKRNKQQEFDVELKVVAEVPAGDVEF